MHWQNIHIIPNDKFTNPYIEFINENFDKDKHCFLILGEGIGSDIQLDDNIFQINKDFKSILELIIRINRAHKIHLHGLFHPQLIFLLYLQPWTLNKCNWIIWGGDLYLYTQTSKGFSDRIYEHLRKFVIKRLKSITTHIKGDYKLAQSWYNTRADYFYSFMYPSNLFKPVDLTKLDKNKDYFYVQVGNSSDPSNNHLEVFDHLEKHKEKKIKIICPLSYGDKEYKNLIIKEGEKRFGDQFVPLTDFISLKDYLNILAKIDVAIFNHKRQQGLGNITTLLGLGKKVYIRDDVTTWDFCKEHGLTVFSTNHGYEDLFIPLDENIKHLNQRVMKVSFSEEKLVKDWEKIFDSGV
ncbi:TDP-N-acetylfucosamine:lipid II N-acetylfucosaminyltransferase [Bacillus salipaludis]|uniref:TDP-N-acetylfucosamine:lipid II N-acetylfucosaminyltransferase n=1 Tax=Bacillus salipaludis TaxID=2547811 RepID=UPI003D1A82BC